MNSRGKVVVRRTSIQIQIIDLHYTTGRLIIINGERGCEPSFNVERSNETQAWMRFVASLIFKKKQQHTLRGEIILTSIHSRGIL